MVITQKRFIPCFDVLKMERERTLRSGKISIGKAERQHFCSEWPVCVKNVSLLHDLILIDFWKWKGAIKLNVGPLHHAHGTFRCHHGLLFWV